MYQRVLFWTNLLRVDLARKPGRTGFTSRRRGQGRRRWDCSSNNRSCYKVAIVSLVTSSHLWFPSLPSLYRSLFIFLLRGPDWHHYIFCESRKEVVLCRL